MKIFCIVFFVFLFIVFVIVFFVFVFDSVIVVKDLCCEIFKMIEVLNLEQLGMKEIFVFINFKVNENNEIIVFNVFGVIDEICEQVKESINYCKVEGFGLDKVQEYNLWVNFVVEGVFVNR